MLAVFFLRFHRYFSCYLLLYCFNLYSLFLNLLSLRFNFYFLRHFLFKVYYYFLVRQFCEAVLPSFSFCVLDYTNNTNNYLENIIKLHWASEFWVIVLLCYYFYKADKTLKRPDEKFYRFCSLKPFFFNSLQKKRSYSSFRTVPFFK